MAHTRFRALNHSWAVWTCRVLYVILVTVTDSGAGTAFLAEAVLNRRKRRGQRQGDIELTGGVSIAVLRNVESGRRDNPQRKTLSGLDRALEWPTGAAKALLDVSDPPFPGSNATDIQAYVKELIYGDFRELDQLAPADAQAARSLPNIVLLAELARRLDVDLAAVTSKAEASTDDEDSAEDDDPEAG